MFSVSAPTLVKVASALMSGDENIIEQLVERKIEQLGQNLIEQIINASPLGDTFSALRRTEAALETGGVSEIDRLRRSWLNSVKPVSDYNRIARKTEGFLKKAFSDEAKSSSHRYQWQRGGWAHSRQQWLAEGWMHDWRSQPRNPAGMPFHIAGAWIPGRLPYPNVVTSTVHGAPLYASPPKGGKTVGRATKAKRKRRREFRALGRRIGSAAVMSSWGKADAT